MRKRDSARTSAELQGYTAELLTDALLESVMTMVDQNFKNLQYLSFIECQIDVKRARYFVIVL